MKKHNFTFNELLLVTVCAFITAALSIAAAKSAADPKITACSDVMRGINQKLTAWENDHDGRLIFINLPSKGIWGRQLRDGGYFDADGFYNDNRNNPKNFSCPAETRVRSYGANKARYISVNVGGIYDYGLNAFINMKPYPGHEDAIKRSEIKNPARKMYLGEGCNYAMLSESKYGTSRHGEFSGNVVFVDGHIEFVKDIPFKDRGNYDYTFWY